MSKRGMTPQKALQLRKKRGIKPTRLQKMRIKRGLSQSELALISNVAIRRIQSYEQRESNIDCARLENLCNLSIALDCKIEDLIESKELIEKMSKAK